MNLPSIEAPQVPPPAIYRLSVERDSSQVSVSSLAPTKEQPSNKKSAQVPKADRKNDGSGALGFSKQLANLKQWFNNWAISSSSIRKGLAQYGINMKKFLTFVGPGYLIAVGYLDPGNWATDLAGGSQFGYSLLFIILISNFLAMLLQSLAVKLGVVSGMDLAQACRRTYPKWGNYILYVLCELAIIACDLAEVIGSAIALNLLLKIPLPWGVAITACDVAVVLLLYKDDSVRAARLLETLVMFLIATVGLCFILELIYSKPNSKDVLKGYLPSLGIFTNNEELYVAISIIGATVMPHNLYLHSHLVKVRKNRDHTQILDELQDNLETGDLATSKRQLFESFVRRTMKFSILDSTIALSYALFVNSAILIVSSANFYYSSQSQMVASLFDAYDLLCTYLGSLGGFFFALGLLFAGQSSTLTATMAGQVIMEGFLGLRLRPWLRRILTRGLAIIPALIIVAAKGGNGLNGLLVASQVVLSLQLPFAVIPLVYFTSCKKVMQIDMGAFQKRDVNPNPAANPPLADNTSPTEPGDSTPNSPIETASVNSEQSHFVDFSNPWWLIILSTLASLIILGLDMILVFTTLRGSS